ncbi:2-phospho-L-lactate guanylyltransferase CofC [Sphingobium chlorophenolicum L-1]|uniref:2-phospho-L-lactate guanylyltransferase CofC n=1 Tax=Sphingobium chlorophenolicum L-1 TaxID=690566 RepID=F6EWS7_SPHCR|nr:2-phospho-L-lactate guanylyltransferase [Sphingobium chlorophenolicum]AEG49865.1 2-phospho-L-lactate guanylyltransferase CofC [Sphingobium chlorophenolicum L-1]
MNCWIVIPVKAPAACKTRLSPVLDEAGRRDLVAEMLHRTVTAATKAVGMERLRLLGPSRHGLPENMGLLDDPGGGLNPAAASARDAALAAGVERLLFLSADLPLVEAADVAALLDVPGIAVAPDLPGQGTNALSLPLPQAADFQFHYGQGSFAAHRAEADRLGLPFSAIVRRGLGFDIDQPRDLAGWKGRAT